MAKQTLDSKAAPALGLRPNARQFALLVLVNAFVGATVGSERTVVPLLGVREFGIASGAALFSFIAAFGLAKAVTNLVAGTWADRTGRRRLLIIGWLVGLPVPVLLILAPPPHWWIVVVANVLLGVNQGLCWSMTVVSKVDLVGPKSRGLALGLNEFAGYLAVGFASLVTGYLAASYSLRPIPFLFMACVVVAGLLLSVFWVRETLPFVRLESMGGSGPTVKPTLRENFARASWRDRTLFASSQAGLVNNLNDGVVWGVLPVLFAATIADVGLIGALVGIYPITWGVAQLATGKASDRIGRKGLIVGGMMLQGASIAAAAMWSGELVWTTAMVGLGIGTAAVYPTLLGAVSDVAHPAERAGVLGVYRFWRDLGYVVGAVAGGLLADAVGLVPTLIVVAALTGGSGLLFAIVARETAPGRGEPQISIGPRLP